MIQAIKDYYTFRIVRKIADGGMGSVYEAIQDGTKGFEKTVALKTLLAQLNQSEKLVDMFIEEGKLVANLVHENIVQIYQLGRTTHGYYIVMEYVNGLSLHELLRSHFLGGIVFPRELSVFVSSRIARGLAYAHSRKDAYGKHMNIVHRDVCPNNVMVTTEGLPKLADFGIAKATSNLRTASDRSLMGKFTYMPPEQATRGAVDFRADIFSLGAILFEMLAGQKIRGEASQEGLHQQAIDGFVDWDSLPDDLDGKLRTILTTCLAPNPTDRYDSTQEVARSLEYHIYKDGYGPTIQTLEEYMRRKFPSLYQVKKKSPQPAADDGKRQGVMPAEVTSAATLIMDDHEPQSAGAE